MTRESREKYFNITICLPLLLYGIFALYGEVILGLGFDHISKDMMDFYNLYSMYEIVIVVLTPIMVIVSAIQLLKKNKNIKILYLTLMLIAFVTYVNFSATHQFFRINNMAADFWDIVDIRSIVKLVYFALVTIYAHIKYGKAAYDGVKRLS